jgi:hypothetical protein
LYGSSLKSAKWRGIAQPLGQNVVVSPAVV